MHFIIDSDSGDAIAGWLAPDNPSSVPHFIVAIPRRDEIVVRANVMREGIRDLGLHATGECGFHIGTDIVPDLAALPDVELLEAESRLPIYRRFQPGLDIDRKLFLFDCSLIPQRRILNEIKSRFSIAHFNSEGNGLETTIAIIANPGNKSMFISGRSALLRYNDMLREKGFLRVALLREPHEELAERLYFLNFLIKEDSAGDFSVYTTGVKNLLDFARDLSFQDLRGLTVAFRGASEQQKRELMSPMTRVFGCDVDEPPTQSSVAVALERLSDFDLVGTRERFPLFKELLAATIGANLYGEEEPVGFQSVRTLAADLAKIGVVNDLLADDILLYRMVEESISDSLSDGDHLAARGI